MNSSHIIAATEKRLALALEALQEVRDAYQEQQREIVKLRAELDRLRRELAAAREMADERDV